MNRLLSLLSHKTSTAFQFVSDLHLEVASQYTTYTIPASAAYLILAGDIGRLIDYDLYLEFLVRHISHFSKIFLVLGNHEFYGITHAEGIQRARKLEQEGRLDGVVKLLNRDRFDTTDSNVTILGCTLWSKIAIDAEKVVQSVVQDFQKIQGWSVDAHDDAHAVDVQWLKDEIRKISKANKILPVSERRKILIVTHHAPCLRGTSRPEHVENPWSSAFATDLIVDGKEAEWEDVGSWIFGHTHFTTELWKCSVRIVSNQRGYVLPGNRALPKPLAKGERSYDVEKVIRI